MRQRVSVIIIKDKKLLLVKGKEGFYSNFYFTPGGKTEEGETDLNAITRECNEELGIVPISAKPYLAYDSLIQGTEEKQHVSCYIVDSFQNEITVNNEVTEVFWYGQEDYEIKSPKIADSIYNNLIPALIKDNLI